MIESEEILQCGTIDKTLLNNHNFLQGVKKNMEIKVTNTDNVRATNEMPSINTTHEKKSQEITASQDNPLNKQEVKELVEKIQGSIDKMDVNLKFSTYGENHERTSITVTEKGTEKEIRKIPSEELQQLYLKMNELTGILFNRTV